MPLQKFAKESSCRFRFTILRPSKAPLLTSAAAQELIRQLCQIFVKASKARQINSGLPYLVKV